MGDFRDRGIPAKGWGRILGVAGVFSLMLLHACGGGSSGGAARYTIGGSVTGLSDTVVLQDNGSDALTLQKDGPFVFSVPVDDNARYDVAVANQPKGETCTVNQGTGTVSGANVTNVAVVCALNAHAVGGVVSGLTGTLVLQDNGGDDLTLSSNGSFAFNTPVAEGSTYAVSVLTQPKGQSCSIGNGSGTILSGPISDVSVTCAADTYTIGGTVSGLDSGKTVVLQNNGADDKTVMTNGQFVFDTAVNYDGAYNVTVSSQPALQTCLVVNEAGSAVADVTDVSVTCVCANRGPRCSGVCADFMNDPANCGQCGMACPGGATCANGVCACSAGQTMCSGQCVDTASDNANCGACGNACGAGAICSAGACKKGYGAACTVDSQCLSDICINGWCQSSRVSGVACTTDQDCTQAMGSNYNCLNGGCFQVLP